MKSNMSNRYLYVYKVFRYCNEYFVFKHQIYHGTRKKKPEIAAVSWEKSPVPRFQTLEEAIAERDRLNKLEEAKS